MIFRPENQSFKQCQKFGLIHGFCPKVELYVKKDHFLIFWIEKNDCQTRKVTFQNVPKNQHFPQGSVYGFCPKIQLFLMSVFCRNYVKKDYVFSIIEREKKDFFTRKVNFQKVPPNRYFPQVQSIVSLWFLSKNQTFSYVCFLS